MTMGNRIAKARKEKCFTQEYVAESLGISRQAVFKWEKNQTKPDTANLIALSELLGVSVEYLTKGVKANTNNRTPGELFFRASLIPLLIMALCWFTGLFSGVYTNMVEIPVGNGIRIGIPLLMYGHSHAAVALVIVSIVSAILFVLLLFLGQYANKHHK